MNGEHSAEKGTRQARRARGRAAGCLGALKCPCLCHDTGGGAHHHYGRVCDGQPGEYTVIPPAVIEPGDAS